LINTYPGRKVATVLSSIIALHANRAYDKVLKFTCKELFQLLIDQLLQLRQVKLLIVLNASDKVYFVTTQSDEFHQLGANVG
jgi:hypothetical protein